MSGLEWLQDEIRLTPEVLGTANPAALRTLVILYGEVYEVVGWEPPNIIVAAPLPMPTVHAPEWS
jgi:hypothetical protein